MRWALLGANTETNNLARILADVPEIDWMVVPATEWESLLALNDVDAVVVVPGLDAPLREEQLKKLVGAAIPVIAVHPAADVLTAYEIEVIRRESGSKLVAYAPGWFHPAWNRLCDLSRKDPSPLGRIESVQFERNVIDRDR